VKPEITGFFAPLPVMGYREEQMRDLTATIKKVLCVSLCLCGYFFSTTKTQSSQRDAQ
jgi:hypothetical protein